MSSPTPMPGLRQELSHKRQGLIRIPSTFYEYNWPHYLPPTALSLYRALCRIAETDLRGSRARYELYDRPFTPWHAENTEIEINQWLLQKLCERKGWTFPANVTQSVDLLLKLSLIQVQVDEQGDEVYDIILPVPHPADILERPELRLPPYLHLPPEEAL
ncbi:DUF6042 family protein [Heliorestis convoluta]|uniref:Uncharacterized protein n=1 Tax=Heliorestis convoluta TaxID=356322 RepID=A0A5Q2N311_9FIRM|nr:DUF6042 family protein [Heliorestis convoluta]QGG48671.1 hypothetical protein FTV88_2578 [Heliorestis convoluta]